MDNEREYITHETPYIGDYPWTKNAQAHARYIAAFKRVKAILEPPRPKPKKPKKPSKVYPHSSERQRQRYARKENINEQSNT